MTQDTEQRSPSSVSAQVARNRSGFDALAGAAAEQMEFRWQARKVARIASLLRAVEPKARGADVGCGTGLMTLEYLRAGVGHFDGFDISEASLLRAAERGITTHRWNADGEPCPAGDAGYDVVVAADVIEHIVDTDAFVREIRRVVAPGGTVIMSTPNLASWYNRLRLLRGLVPVGFPGVSPTVAASSFVDLDHIRVNVGAEWTNLFHHHGLQVQSLSGCAALFEAWEGTARAQILKRTGRVMEQWPALADLLIFVLRRPATD